MYVTKVNSASQNKQIVIMAQTISMFNYCQSVWRGFMKYCLSRHRFNNKPQTVYRYKQCPDQIETEMLKYTNFKVNKPLFIFVPQLQLRNYFSTYSFKTCIIAYTTVTNQIFVIKSLFILVLRYQYFGCILTTQIVSTVCNNSLLG